LEEARSQLETVQTELAAVTADRDDKIQQLESKIQNLESQLAERDAERAAVVADREDLAQFKKEAKEAAAEVHREGQAIEALKTRWQQEVSDAKSELADAKATILKQNNQIRELERGFSFKPNPKESALRLEIGNLQAELEAYKQQQPAPAIDLPEQVAEIVDFLKGLLPPDTKWPKRIIPELRKFLEAKEG
jgi:chromosome segregation ATPase